MLQIESINFTIFDNYYFTRLEENFKIWFSETPQIEFLTLPWEEFGNISIQFCIRSSNSQQEKWWNGERWNSHLSEKNLLEKNKCNREEISSQWKKKSLKIREIWTFTATFYQFWAISSLKCSKSLRYMRFYWFQG